MPGCLIISIKHADEPKEDGAQAICRPLEPRVTHFLLADKQALARRHATMTE